MPPMEMHHAMHPSGGGLTALRLGLVLAVVVATAVHIRFERPRGAASASASASGSRAVWAHALMGVAMATMLLPEPWRTLPPAVWDRIFLAVGIVAAGGAVRRCRAGDRRGARRHADLVVGAAAMEFMARGWVTDRRVAGLLAAYFVVQALAAAAGLARLARRAGRRVAAPASAPASRAVLAAVMAYMLVGH